MSMEGLVPGLVVLNGEKTGFEWHCPKIKAPKVRTGRISKQ